MVIPVRAPSSLIACVKAWRGLSTILLVASLTAGPVWAEEEQPLRMQCNFADLSGETVAFRADSSTVCLSRLKCWPYTREDTEGVRQFGPMRFGVVHPENTDRHIYMDFHEVTAVVVDRDGPQPRKYTGQCQLH